MVDFDDISNGGEQRLDGADRADLEANSPQDKEDHYHTYKQQYEESRKEGTTYISNLQKDGRYIQELWS